MTKYYIGYIQGNNSYVYVNSLMFNSVNVSVTTTTAIGIDNEKTAKEFLDVVKSIDNEKDYKLLKVTADIEEVK